MFIVVESLDSQFLYQDEKGGFMSNQSYEIGLSQNDEGNMRQEEFEAIKYLIQYAGDFDHDCKGIDGCLHCIRLSLASKFLKRLEIPFFCAKSVTLKQAS